MRVAGFFLCAGINATAYFSLFFFLQEAPDPVSSLLVLAIIVWLSFILCLAFYVAGASKPDGRLEFPKNAIQLAFLFFLVPQFGISFGLALNYSEYEKIVVSWQEIQGAEVERTGHSIARLKGEIGPQTISSLIEVDRRKELKMLELDSIGGVINAADEIGKFVERRGVAIFVRNSCKSACLLIALSGEKLLVTSDSEFGFHRASTAADINSELGRFLSRSATIDFIELLRKRGVHQSILDITKETPADEMYYISGQEMYRLGLADQIIN